MKKLLLRFFVYALTFVVLVGGVGAFGLMQSQKNFYLSIRQEAVPSLQGLEKPKYDSTKPTVAVILGNETTEGSDFAIPYELFSRTGAYNVYAVASDNQVRSLTGGLDVMPHFSFTEIDQLLGKGPDIIVIPYMTVQDEEKFQPVKEWIQHHSQTTILSICGGSGNLAETGLLKGKSAASHWQNMPFFPEKFPETNWLDDQRYVHDGNVITSAGVSSGIDAVLYTISLKLGEPMAKKIAEEIKYPSYHFVQDPKMTPFGYNMNTYLLNNAYQWNKTQAGVLLYNGVEEMALASVFDIYSDTGTTNVLAISSSNHPIVTKHGLNLISRYLMSNVSSLDKMIVPGREAKNLAEADLKQWNEQGNTQSVQFVHNESPDRFIFEVQFEDLAKQEDLLTAEHAVRRLEFRADDIHLEGKPFSFETYANILFTGLLALFIAYYLDRRFILKKRVFKSHNQVH